ncbi:SidA/IucD/PvdA family monooxygenase [Pseudomonas huanghezhanensis]|uniref:SidA/IucD/PvdA family monooxygenase n=1 Tax=Pseudomonas huanghezhanensis TaxID=3002903 RepID=UPI0038B4F02E
MNNIAVIGGGQSSVEIYQSCLEQFPQANVKMIMRSIGLVNYEGSKFTNTLFSNDQVNTFFNIDARSRAQVLAEMHTTNYSGVAPVSLDTLYRFHYLQELNGSTRAAIYTQCNIQSAYDDGLRIILTWFNKVQSKTETEQFDLVFLGTGYKNTIPDIFNESMLMMDRTSFNVSRHYRAELPYVGGASLHLQGVNESTHGIADSLLSVLAQRSQEIVNDLYT